MRYLAISIFALLATQALAACGAGAGDGGEDVVDAAPIADGGEDRPDSSFAPPRDDLVPAVGSDATLDLATWNLEHFPLAPATTSLAADLITSLDIDFLAVQEIEDVAAWDELVERLRDYDALLSSHAFGNGDYQKVGFLYKRDLISVTGGALLFTDEGFVFPRPPLQAVVTADDGVHPPIDFVAIVVHLKAGLDGDDIARREDSVRLLEAHLRELVESVDEDVVVLGDFNDVVTGEGDQVMAPLLGDQARYHFHTSQLAASGAYTFIPTEVMLDHIVSTVALADERAGGTDRIPDLETELGNYEGDVSDHLPIIVSLPVFE